MTYTIPSMDCVVFGVPRTTADESTVRPRSFTPKTAFKVDTDTVPLVENGRFSGTPKVATAREDD